MSVATLAAIENALAAHFQSIDDAEPGSPRPMVTAWVVGVELTRLSEDGDGEPEYRNTYAASPSSPNTLNGLAADVQARIEYDTSDEEDEL